MKEDRNKKLQNPDMDGFDVERMRRDLVAEKKYDQLLMTYRDSLATIPDMNSPEFWDIKFAKKNPDQHFMEEHRNSLIAKKIIKLNKKKVLDVGCGKAKVESLLYYKLSKRLDITCTDFTERTLQENRNKFPKWKFVKANPTDLPLKNGIYDIALLLEVLEHITPSNTFIVLSEIHRVLKKGGYFFLSIPINEGLREMFPNNPNSHVRVYSKELVLFELMHAGFEPFSIIELSAFSSNYYLKHFINSIFKIKKPNNLIILSRKRS